MVGFDSIDSLEFSFDGVRSLPVEEVLFFEPPEIVQRVVVQPIVAANDDGSNRANFLGTPEQEADILERVDQIFAQAGVDVEFLEEAEINSTFINFGDPNSDVRSLSDFRPLISTGDAAGVGSSDPNVVDLYFIQRTPDTRAGAGANGRGFNGQSGAVVHLPDSGFDTTFFGGDIERFARLIAHEIGHNLGLSHTDLPTVLASQTPNRFLNDAQIDTILDSSLTQRITSRTLAEVESPREAVVQATALSSNDNAQADTTSTTGGCGSCGFCAACTGAAF